MTNVRTVGFSLVELLVGLTIAAILVMLALPSYSVWVADAQIRNAAESIASGLRYAQGQAIATNSRLEFVLDPTTGTGGWTVRQIDPACATIATPQVGTFREGADRTALVALPAGATKVQFTSLGAMGAPCDASAQLNTIQISSATGVVGARNLNVIVGGVSALAGQVGMNKTGIKVCDPKWPATDPKGCPT